MSERLWQTLKDHKARHAAKGNSFSYKLYGPDDVAGTLVARYYKDGANILIDQPDKSTPRRLTPRECARLMGYPDSFVFPCSDTQTYKQLGNSVVPPLVRYIADKIPC